MLTITIIQNSTNTMAVSVVESNGEPDYAKAADMLLGAAAQVAKQAGLHEPAFIVAAGITYGGVKEVSRG